jgi:hypothetical protein
MQQATMSQFGPMHAGAAGAQIEQTQPQMQLKAGSSATKALSELD